MGKVIKCLAVMLIFASSTIAEFITITAAGQVTSAQNSTVLVGASVQYSFIFDFNSDGYTLNDQSVIEYKLDDSRYDYFFCDFIGDYLLQDYNVQSNFIEKNYGFRYFAGTGCYLYGGTGTHLIRLSIPGSIDQLAIGSKVSGQEASKITDKLSEFIKSDLEIISIVSDVPEPSILSLLWFGLLFFVPKACTNKKSSV